MRLRRLRNATGVLTAIAEIIKQSWVAYPAGFAGLLLLEMLQGLLPLPTAWVAKILFDSLAQHIRQQVPMILPSHLFLLLIAQASLAIIGQMSAPLNTYLNAELRRRLTLTVQTTIYRKINSFVGLEPFEDPRFHDTILLGSQGAQQGASQAIGILTGLLRSMTTLTTFLSVLLPFSPFLAGMIGLVVPPQLYIQMKLGRQRIDLAVKSTPQQRRASYYGFALSAVQFAKELRLFGIGEYFLQQWMHISSQLQGLQQRQQVRELRWQIVLSVLANLIASGAFAVVTLQAFAGRLGLGDVILYTSAVGSVQGALTGMILVLANLNESVLFYNRFTALLALPQPVRIAESPVPVPPLTHSIELRDVSFRYSEQHPWVLRHLNLVIPIGHCVALVGLNGAGKTTLVKLLTRLYDPTEGAILWDGIDCRAFSPEEFRRHCGAVFQDFIHYDLTAYENIGLVGHAANSWR